MLRLHCAVLGLLLAGVLTMPAAAEDCYTKIRMADAHHAAPHPAPRPHKPRIHRIHHVHHVRRAVHPKAVVKKAKAPGLPPVSHRQWLESSAHRASIPTYVLRPVSCDKPLALQTAAPTPERPPAQLLLDEIAGPAPTGTRPRFDRSSASRRPCSARSGGWGTACWSAASRPRRTGWTG